MPNIAKIIYIKTRFYIKYWFSKSSIPEYNYLLNRKKCFVFLAADYGNLGDVAITYAQEKFLKDNFPGYTIVDVPISKTLSDLKTLQNICSSDDIVTIVGGGNMSDLYFDIELLRQMVVKAFPNNRVISFPQTMFFSDSLSGNYLKRQAVKVYSRHINLTITARERWSHEMMKSILPSCKLIPDIVMTLDKREPISTRKGITFCMRNDIESGISQEFKEELRLQLANQYDIVDYDTHIGRGGLSIREREQELNKIWSQFRSSEWVITDRLHGMIFAYITGSPCIVLPNNNYKIEGCYSWIKDCGYIFYTDEYDLNKIVDVLCKRINNFDFDSSHTIINNKTQNIKHYG